MFCVNLFLSIFIPVRKACVRPENPYRFDVPPFDKDFSATDPVSIDDHSSESILSQAKIIVNTIMKNKTVIGEKPIQKDCDAAKKEIIKLVITT